MKQVLKLKQIMTDLALSQSQLAAHVSLSPATIAQLINHSYWPRAAKQYGLRDNITEFLKRNGATEEQIAVAFERNATAGRCGGARTTAFPVNEDEHMSIRKQILHPQTLRHFKLPGNPFDEVNSADEFYANEQLRYTRAQLLDACKRGGFVAVVGESGSGKTTLRRDLQERVQRADMPIQIIRPYVVGMESDDVKGKTLKAGAILDAIMATIAPHEPLRSSSDARYRQLENRLKESHRTGTRHVVLIEEAHAMPKATLRHLKRFVELEDGFSRLLSVILLGQNELAESSTPRPVGTRSGPALRDHHAAAAG